MIAFPLRLTSALCGIPESNAFQTQWPVPQISINGAIHQDVIVEKNIIGMKSSVCAKKTENSPALETTINGDSPATVVVIWDMVTTKPLDNVNLAFKYCIKLTA